jgi:hypothetical protein
VHAALLNTGKVNVPTLPLGAVPAQFVPFDHLGSPTAAAPLQVKFAASAEAAKAAKPQTATATTRLMFRSEPTIVLVLRTPWARA